MEVELVENNAVDIKKSIDNMLSLVEGMIVQNVQQYNELSDMYAAARTLEEMIEEKRKELTEPLRKQISTINERAKEVSTPIKKLIEVSNTKAESYVAFQKEEEKRLKDAAFLLDINLESNVIIMPASNSASMVTKTVKKFRVTDMEKVPREYLILDEAKVGVHMKIGVTSIPGIEFYEETTTTLRRK